MIKLDEVNVSEHCVKAGIYELVGSLWNYLMTTPPSIMAK